MPNDLIKGLINIRLGDEYSESDFRIIHNYKKSALLEQIYSQIIETIVLRKISESSYILELNGITGIAGISFSLISNLPSYKKRELANDLAITIDDTYERHYSLRSPPIKQSDNRDEINFKLDNEPLRSIIIQNVQIDALQSITLVLDPESTISQFYGDNVNNAKKLKLSKQSSLIEKNDGTIQQQQRQINELKREHSHLKSEITETIEEHETESGKLKRLKSSIKDFPDSLEGYRKQNNLLTILYSVFIILSIFTVWFVSDYFFKIINTKPIPESFSLSDAATFALYKFPATALALAIITFVTKLVRSFYGEIMRLNNESLKMTQSTVLVQSAYESVPKSDTNSSKWHEDNWREQATQAKIQLITKIITERQNVDSESSPEK